jgi:hypothetical protein
LIDTVTIVFNILTKAEISASITHDGGTHEMYISFSPQIICSYSLQTEKYTQNNSQSSNHDDAISGGRCSVSRS